ncbi:MAG: hypothetical protein CML13_05030 [Puniceicoccaceae bacterium]|nr:hypothetical protein [Puniceicoccaceae bacterium]
MKAEISSATADSQIEARMDVAKSKAALLKTDTLAEPSVRETVSSIGGRDLILRKILPIPLPKASGALKLNEPLQGFSAELLQRIQEAQVLEPVQLRLSATVFGGEYTELTLSLEKRRYEIWTNVDFSYLPFLGNFATDTRSYNYTGFNYEIDSDLERKRAIAAQKLGFKYRTQWRKPPVKFTSREPEYVLVMEGGGIVPKEVYRQLDDLISYYLEHFASLKLSHDNALKLQAAQERYDARHPEVPQDIILNFTRVSESDK